MDMNPAMEMDVPNGTEDTTSKFVPPVDVNDQKFIDLAKKMKKLSPETLEMIQKDLQPEQKSDESPEDDKEDKPEVEMEKEDPRAKLIIGLKKVLSLV